MHVESLRIFVDVVKRGSFAEVARDYNVAPSSISRTVASLEKDLGICLFLRSTRKLEPTEAGMAYFDAVVPILEDLEGARDLARKYGDQAKGHLRITAPMSFSELKLSPILTEFALLYPKITFDIIFTESILDLFAERIDVAIQLGQQPGAGLVVQRLCALNYVLCASPDYLARCGVPVYPQDLLEQDCLVSALNGKPICWIFRERSGNILELPLKPRAIMTNGMVLRQWAIQGLGITLLPYWTVEQALESGELVSLLDKYEKTCAVFKNAVWLVYPSRQYLPYKVKLFTRFLKNRLAETAVNWRPYV